MSKELENKIVGDTIEEKLLTLSYKYDNELALAIPDIEDLITQEKEEYLDGFVNKLLVGYDDDIEVPRKLVGEDIREMLEHYKKTMPKKLENKIEDYLFRTNIRWSELYTRIRNRIMVSPKMVKEYKETKSELLDLITQEKEEYLKEFINWQIDEDIITMPKDRAYFLLEDFEQYKKQCLN